MKRIITALASALVLVSLTAFITASAARIASIANLDVHIDGEFAVSAPFNVARAAGDGSADKGKGAVSKKSSDPKVKSPVKKGSGSVLMGTWQCQMQGGTSTLVFESDSCLNLDGQPAGYRVVANALRVQDEDGAQDYPFKLDNNVLTISFAEGYALQFTKTSDETVYSVQDYSSEMDTEPGAYGEGQTVGEVPAGERTGGQTPAGSDQDLMNHFAGTWWNATTHTETNVTLTADGRYFESSAASYSGGSSDQYGNSDMSWGAAGDQTAQGTWTVRGTREQGVLTIFFNNGSQREIDYQVHVENGEVYWSEYYFNGELYGKK